ncbi:MAG: hypothetical protein V1807_02275 [Patescibacteria group bacterium]
MAQNSVSMLLKLILAGVVITLIVGIANYLSISKSVSGLADSQTQADIISEITSGQALAATAPNMCILPVKLGTKLTQSQLASFFGSELTAQFGITSPFLQRIVCGMFRSVILNQEKKQPGFIQMMVTMQETGNGNPAKACDVPDTLTGLPFKMLC